MNSYTKKALTFLCAALFFLTAVPQAFADEQTNDTGTEAAILNFNIIKSILV